MKRIMVSMAALVVAIAVTASPAASATSTPSASISKSGDCHSIAYTWSNFRKAQTAEFRIHHFGIFETSRQRVPVGPGGTFAMPSDVTFVSGDQYTVLGVLLDSGGRSINPSGAAWWGVC